MQVAAFPVLDPAAPSDVPLVDAIAPALTSPPIMSQQWCDLAFLHWFVPPARVQSWMPPGATPDLVPSGPFAGLTPVALVPFRMVDAGFGSGPAVPYFGTFWETNVRLYSIDAAGTHGIVFCSLDASRLAVVLAARIALGLPYRFSRMRGYARISGRESGTGLDRHHPMAGASRDQQSYRDPGGRAAVRSRRAPTRGQGRRQKNRR